MNPLQFEIEYILEITEGYLITRLLQPGAEFTLTEKSTLGGYPIDQSFTMPRALDSDGKPRFDLFMFQLKNELDARKFMKGQVVELLV